MYRLWILCLLVAGIAIFSSQDAFAQKRPKKEKPKKEKVVERKKGEYESISLDKIEITFRVQTPKVKFNIERIPIDVKTDHARFGDISKEVEMRGHRVLYSDRIYEKPIEISPREVVNRERQ
ncbi:MAG: hypothetical protein RMI34_05540 [Chloroherpetonaceae bacterium]|nr:hypothetical protein [Chloroherpetonaceae bacterium]MCS7212475.1 hypothetical protein [Chloroherpetonaceae bacterium]MDW8019523.1 hypothetical protein [Chloroherpetonaceae bacterium]MDW8466268.1 hypothetical protein [Chloroherpetonaceae bacterium]